MGVQSNRLPIKRNSRYSLILLALEGVAKAIVELSIELAMASYILISLYR